MKIKQMNVKEHEAPIIFLDEWAKASPEIRRAAFEIMMARKLQCMT